MKSDTHPVLVAVVDDDESVREALPGLLQACGFATQAFASAEEFLASDCIRQAQCLIADVAMPGMSGLHLHMELKSRGHRIPTIFITAYGGEAIPRRLLDKGATAWLCKPFSDTALLESVAEALAQA
jgi:FixJ family two-component response regulator